MPGFAHMHPFAPAEQFDGYRQLFDDLQRWLAEITGYDAISLQPNAGSQGEFAGLLAIRNYHRAQRRGAPRRLPDPGERARHQRGERRDGRHARRRRQDRRRAGRDRPGRPARARSPSTPTRLAAIMVTYPSTHGVFEEHIGEVCALVHDAGGQVYVDGANLNAMVGLGPARQVRRRRVAPEPAQDVLHPARRRRSGRRADRRTRAPGAVPAQPSAAAAGRAGDGGSGADRRPRRGARRRSCRSPGPTSG